MTRFMQEFMGRGPKDIRSYLVGDLMLVRLQGILSAGETSLAAVLPARSKCRASSPIAQAFTDGPSHG
jgi:uncharacterized protein YbcI